jgi:tRNA A-37 threonylcarbamoyl transferase component Bud32
MVHCDSLNVNWRDGALPEAEVTQHDAIAQELSSLSNEDLSKLFKAGSTLPEDTHPYPTPYVRQLREHFLGKISQEFDDDITDGQPSEVVTLRAVAEFTTIPVPKVQRVIRLKYEYLIVMDYIPGQQLSTVWPTMSPAEKNDVAETLRDYVRQLRSIDIPRRQVPGPLSTDHIPRTCESDPVFGEFVKRGPFASSSELADFFNRRHDSYIRCMDPGSKAPRLDMPYPLVLTHQDINPRNVIVGDDGRLWLIDWAWSGFYPEWWESLAMKVQARNEEFVTKRKDPSWAAIIPIVCGKYEDVEEWFSTAGRMLAYA